MKREPPELVGESPSWLECLERVSTLAPVDRPVLVIGERGTGKELIAERLHFLSLRWDAPFVKVNCAALSQDLLDSDLFGHEQGAFTGAARRRQGRFEQADGGTLFLDEIATAPLQVQEKLLRVIEYGEFQRLGGEETLTCDVRIVAATNVDLPGMAAQGKFRADLLDRLAFDVVTLAPLRARRGDILVLADYFAGRIAREMGETFNGFSLAAMDALIEHPWPGNVRELRNVAERAVVRELAQRRPGAGPGPASVTPDMLDPFASPWRPSSQLATAASPAVHASPSPAPPPAPALATPAPTRPEEPVFPIDLTAQVRALEISMLDAALRQNGGRQGKAAEALGLTYHQFRGLLKKYRDRKNNPETETEQDDSET